MRKQPVSNTGQTDGDTSNVASSGVGVVEGITTPIITVTTPSKGSCNITPTKEVILP